MPDEPKHTEEIKKDGKTIEIRHFDVEKKLLIDGKEVPFERDDADGVYRTVQLPYRTFGSLKELARACVED